jgi:hypothetical protein
MKILYILLSILLLFIACDNSGVTMQKPPESEEIKVDNVMQQKADVSSSLKSYGSRNNLVDQVFQKLIDINPSLKKLVEYEDELNKNFDYSIEKYREINISKTSYYYDAGSYPFKDSVLKREITAILKNSQSAYESKYKSTEKLIADFEEGKLSIDDQINALKVLATLKAVEGDTASYSNTVLLKVVAQQEKYILDLKKENDKLKKGK